MVDNVNFTFTVVVNQTIITSAYPINQSLLQKLLYVCVIEFYFTEFRCGHNIIMLFEKDFEFFLISLQESIYSPLLKCRKLICFMAL